MTFYGVINKSSGPDGPPDGFQQDLRDRLDKAGFTGDLHFGEGEELADLMDAAKDSDAEMLLVGGGDGTIRHAARAAMQADMILAIVPLGTINLFARDLGLPLDWPVAVDALGEAREIRVDTADVNDTVYLCQSSIGLVPQLAKQRERMREQGWVASLLGVPARLAEAVFHVRKRRLELAFEDEDATVRSWLTVVNNNRPDEPMRMMPRRSRLDRGHLAVHWANVDTRAGLLWLLLSYALNFMGANPHIQIRQVEAFEIAAPGEQIEIGIDGEVMHMQLPLRFRIHPKSLRVLAPPPSEETQ
jgi:diacylglycerol kinase family enzyme